MESLPTFASFLTSIPGMQQQSCTLRIPSCENEFTVLGAHDRTNFLTCDAVTFSVCNTATVESAYLLKAVYHRRVSGIAGTSAHALPDVNADDFDLVLRYCYFYSSVSVCLLSDLQRENWDSDFLSVDAGTLCRIATAAYHLQIDRLVDLACREISKHLAGKSSDDMLKSALLTPNPSIDFALSNKAADKTGTSPPSSLSSPSDPSSRTRNKTFATGTSRKPYNDKSPVSVKPSRSWSIALKLQLARKTGRESMRKSAMPTKRKSSGKAPASVKKSKKKKKNQRDDTVKPNASEGLPDETDVPPAPPAPPVPPAVEETPVPAEQYLDSSSESDSMWSSESDYTPEDDDSVVLVEKGAEGNGIGRDETRLGQIRWTKTSNSSLDGEKDLLDQAEKEGGQNPVCSGCEDIAFCASFEEQQKLVSTKRDAVRKITLEVSELEDLLSKKRLEVTTLRSELDDSMTKLSDIIESHSGFAGEESGAKH